MNEQERISQRTENFQKFLKDLQEESDRGCVIVSAAILDDILLKLLKQRLVPSLEEKKDELFTDGKAASSFSARIDLAYRVGLIRSNVKATFHLIRKIRNDFAHISDALTFNSNKIKDRVLEIFNLNKSIMDAFSESMRAENIEIFKEHNFVEALGTRKAYEYLMASIATFLLEAVSDVEPIKPLE